ncbi:hypothetical protein [Nocardioides zeicaulis]|uniref:Aerotolerance regulator N-terminal domain-containing protein n=1 Tax=Nocardioides zeicaulis TaxID=1776857 RepID=A0ABV6E4G4_9ACTN
MSLLWIPAVLVVIMALPLLMARLERRRPRDVPRPRPARVTRER